MSIMPEGIEKGSFIVLSDFHSSRVAMQKLLNHYINEYEKIYILGDVTDRGDYGEGEEGVGYMFILKHLCEAIPDRVHYIPGNHDQFLYDYCNGVPNAMANLYINHGKGTIEDINKLRREHPDELRNLINWLGRQPLQKMIEYTDKNGTKKRYALAHAFFNKSAYDWDPNFCLAKMSRYGSETNVYRSFFQTLWFRKYGHNEYDNYNPNTVPSDVDAIVIGHTPPMHRATNNLNLINASGNETRVICVDGGITYKDGNMLKFTNYYDEPIRTVQFYHNEPPSRHSK